MCDIWFNPATSKFLTDFASQVIAAIAGAGIGALLGAHYAFRLERIKAATAREEAARTTAAELSAKRAVSGNLAMHSLGRMHNTLAGYRRQFIEPAQQTVAPWMYMSPGEIPLGDCHRFNAASLAFLLQSSNPNMLLKLALAEEQYAAAVQIISRRSVFHEQTVPAAVEKLTRNVTDLTEPELRQLVGPYVYTRLFLDTGYVVTLVELALTTCQKCGDELNGLLRTLLPGEKIISFGAGQNLGESANG